jgi:uncharacterized protein YbjT (DUF2867 family)
MILVMGATGQVGSKITGHLLSANQEVRCLARHFPNKELFKGADIRQGDANSVAFLSQAMRGCDAVFTMTPPMPLEAEIRYAQNKFGEVIAEAIEEAGIKKVVNLSSVGANLDSGTGPIVGLHDQEQRLNEITHSDVMHLRSAYFMENLLDHISDIISYNRIYDIIPADIPISMIATQDVAARAAFLLMNPHFEGHSVEYLLGERDLSFSEISKILRSALKKSDLEYEEISAFEKKKMLLKTGLLPSWADAFIEISEALANGTLAGSQQRTKLNSTATSIESFASTTFLNAYHQAVTEAMKLRTKLGGTRETHP